MTISYNYKSLIEEINEDITDGILNLEDDLYIMRRSMPIAEDYRPIIDYEYSDIPEESLEKIKVSDLLKEMKRINKS